VLNDPSVHPFDELQEIGTAIKTVDRNSRQRHVGFIYRAPDNSIKMLDLAWHHLLRNLDADPAISGFRADWIK
jgi:hypothetical protein